MQKRLRFAHIEGYTDVTYSDDGQSIITCGSDGDYRIWNGFEDDDPVCTRVGDEATCIGFKNGKVYVGTDMHALQIYSVVDNQPDGIASRFTANVTHLSINKDGSKIAAGSGDMTIRVKDNNSKGNYQETIFDGHTAPILCVSLDPKSEYLASSSCDGTVRVWSLSTKKQLQSWPWAPQSNDFSNSPSLARVHFEPSTGRFLAVPVHSSSSVKILERGSWKQVSELEDDRLNQVSICCWSPCGKYLATCAKDGNILVWDMHLKSVVYHYRHEKSLPICSLAWNPAMITKKEIVFCDSRGQLGLLENVTQQELLTSEKVKSSTSPTDMSLPNDNEDEAEISITQIKRNTGFVINEENGLDVFAGVRPAIMDVDGLTDVDGSKNGSRAPSPTGSIRRTYTSSYKMQEPFQPGSSPTHLQNRYMVWNNVGMVKCYNDDDRGGEGSIDVEFHDTSVHHALHIPNLLGHSMAALSTQALLLACQSQDDSPSKIVCVHFGSWDGHKEWSTVLPNGEEAMAVTVSDCWVAVATSRRLLRLFTVTGLQRGMLSLPGPIVSMAAHGRKLLLIFHYGMGLPGEQSLGYGLLNVDHKSAIGYEWLSSPQVLPLGPNNHLSWVGFTDEGTPATMDSWGLVQINSRGLWIPLLDTRQNIKGKSDHYFILGLSESEKTLRCILCKGARYPPTLPRPNMSLLDIRLPLCDTNNEKTQLEEAFITSSMLAQLMGDLDEHGCDVNEEAKEKSNRTFKESLMKMFALACQSDREVRAFEVAGWMNSEQLLQLAVKYATRARKRHLADRLTELAEQWVRDQETQEAAAAAELEESSLSRRNSSFFGTGRSASQQYDDDRDMFATTQSQDSIVIEDNPILQAKQHQQQRASVSSSVENKTIRPLSQTKKNPFAKKSEASASPRGLAIFDAVKEKGAAVKSNSSSAKENVNAKTKSTKQPTLFSMKKTTSTDDSAASQSSKTGFMLWLELNKAQLQEENPDATEVELTRLAAQKFRALPEDQRQKFNRKRKASEEEECGDGVKKSRPPETVSQKLSSFVNETE